MDFGSPFPPKVGSMATAKDGRAGISIKPTGWTHHTLKSFSERSSP